MPAFRAHETGTTDEPWDGPMMKTRVRSGEERAYYGKIFAWYDPDADEGNKSDYKFIHHMCSMDGEPGDANTNGCSAGIGVLNGGRGGTNIPEADRQEVYDHLAKHIRDAGKEPPELAGEFATAPSGPPQSGHGQTQRHREIEVEYGEVLRRASAEAWAILPTALPGLLAVPQIQNPKSRIQNPEAIPQEDFALTRPGPKSGRVARLPIMGPITRRGSFWDLLFGGGANVEALKKSMRDLAADDSISTVLLHVDSPGGTVSGIPELAGEVRRLAESKHVVAMADSLMASAAYWIASQADEIVAAPEALVGSIGVFTIHEDWSAFLEKFGVKISYIHAGKYKVDGNFEAPLGEEARSHIQSIVDDAYRLFVEDVARGRKTAVAAVKAGYGEGRVLTAKDAKAAGLIDRVAGFEETMKRLSGMRAEKIQNPKAKNQNPDGGNSQARNALKRRRLELLQKSLTEVER